MSKTFKIGDRMIGGNNPAYIIAEAGANHNGDIEIAKDMVFAAKEVGIDCIKFQTYTPSECLTENKTFTYKSQGKEVTESEFDLLERLALKEKDWVTLMELCKKENIFFMTTTQDSVDLSFMQNLGLQAIKKGSDDFDYIDSLVEAAKTGLPLILSKGMADICDVDRTINSLRKHTDKLSILHCVSLYPADPALLNLRQIPKLQSLYPDVIWGFSDHSMGTLASTLAVSLGAKVIEKHFTLDHDMPGPDHWFSMDVAEMKKLVEDIRFAEQALGTGDIVLAEGEKNSKKIMRRRVVARNELNTGDILSDQTVSFKRAVKGCYVDDWTRIQGKKVNKVIADNTGIDFSDIDFSE